VPSLAPRNSWLHFATHGLIRDDMPLDSMLVLGADGKDADADGRWTAREILDLDLDAELVVLSGCDTGRGRITGDGVLGLGRAFLSAGARSVLVSLARVEDEATRELMVRFYRELRRNGGNLAAALRHAQLAAIGEPPARWASFVFIVEN
jgi:CHAT domain-containing protein